MTSIPQIQEPRPPTRPNAGEGNMAAQPPVSSYSGPSVHVTVNVHAVSGGPTRAGMMPEERFFTTRMLFRAIVGIAVGAVAAALQYLLR